MRARTGTNTGFVTLGEELTVDASREVFANFGLAIYVANVLEYAIMYALFALELGPKFRSFTSKEDWDIAYDNFFDKGLSLTFGHLINRLISHSKLTIEAVDALQNAKMVRDNLVHRFAKETPELIFNETGRQEIIKNCESAVALFEACHDDVEAIAAQQLIGMGIDANRWNQRIEQEMDRLIAQAGHAN